VYTRPAVVDPEAMRAAREQANATQCPLVILLAHEGVRQSLLRPEWLGVRTLCRLRRVCRAARVCANAALKLVPRILLLGGTTKKYSGINLDHVKSLELGSMSFLQQASMPSQRSGHGACTLADGRGTVVVVGGQEHCWVPPAAQPVSAPAGQPLQQLVQESSTAAMCTQGVWSALPPMATKRYGEPVAGGPVCLPATSSLPPPPYAPSRRVCTAPSAAAFSASYLNACLGGEGVINACVLSVHRGGRGGPPGWAGVGGGRHLRGVLSALGRGL
jgi:hypothetical protein